LKTKPIPPPGGKTKGGTDMPEKKITQTAETHKEKIVTKHNNFIDGKIIKDMFNRKVIDHIAKETGFIRRERKLDAYNFFRWSLVR
jgi:hypothetical protein